MPQIDLGRVDPGGMYDALRSFPEHLRLGRERAAATDPGDPLDGARSVVVSGMGGSAISGDLLAALASRSARVPIYVSRSYTLPGFVDEHTVVIVSSYSGQTEETLSAMDDAVSREARLIAIAAGGAVAERARHAGIPLYVLPGGMQPRAALGYSFSTLLTIAEQIGLYGTGAEAWEEVASIANRQSELFAELDGNPARNLAEQLIDRLPFVYSGNGVMAPVTTRWCCQIEENAKVLAHGAWFPEQNHNEIVGWETKAEFQKRIAIVALRDGMDHPRVSRRLDLTRELLQNRAAAWIDVESQGASDLARVISLVQLGDWMSFYLAVLRQVDPTPVNLIQQLKQSL